MAVSSPAAALAAASDRELSERMATDHEAFEALYRRHLPTIHAFAYRRTGSRGQAEDVAATTFERALRSAHSFRWTRGGVLAWLYRIAGNVLVDAARSRATERGPRGVLGATRAGPSHIREPGEGADPDDLEALRRALDRLRPRYQKVIALRYLAELEAAEAAAVMGVTRPTLAVTLHRAISALRKEMDSEGQRHG